MSNREYFQNLFDFEMANNHMGDVKLWAQGKALWKAW